jgi:hypothetical protein
MKPINETHPQAAKSAGCPTCHFAPACDSKSRCLSQDRKRRLEAAI